MQCAYCSKFAETRCSLNCGYIACQNCASTKPHSHQPQSAKDRLLFDKFYYANLGSILVPPYNYEIDYNQLNDWLNAIKVSGGPDELTMFAETVARHLTVISFSQFNAKVNQATQELRHRIEEIKASHVYLVVDCQFRSAKTWYALLCWRVLRSVVSDIVPSLEKIPANKWNENIAVIYLEDLVYTGEKIVSALEPISALLKPESNLFLLTPYISSSAKKQINNASSYVKFLQTTKKIPSLEECLESDGHNSIAVLDILKIAPWRNYNSVSALTYFDHRISESGSHSSLVWPKIFDANGNQYASTIFVDAPVTRVNFYKTIRYAFQGSYMKSESGTLLEAIHEQVKKDNVKLFI